MGYALERARPSDVDEVYANICAVREAGIGVWDEYYPDLEIVKDDAERGWLYVARENGTAGGIASGIATGRIIASIVISDSENEDAEELEGCDIEWQGEKPSFLSRLCVAPGLQGRGIGTEMMRLALGVAWGLGYDSVRLLAAEDNPTAVGIYERLSFRRCGEVDMFDEHFIVFEKTRAGTQG